MAPPISLADASRISKPQPTITSISSVKPFLPTTTGLPLVCPLYSFPPLSLLVFSPTRLSIPLRRTGFSEPPASGIMPGIYHMMERMGESGEQKLCLPICKMGIRSWPQRAGGIRLLQLALQRTSRWRCDIPMKFPGASQPCIWSVGCQDELETQIRLIKSPPER